MEEARTGKCFFFDNRVECFPQNLSEDGVAHRLALRTFASCFVNPTCFMLVVLVSALILEMRYNLKSKMPSWNCLCFCILRRELEFVCIPSGFPFLRVTFVVW